MRRTVPQRWVAIAAGVGVAAVAVAWFFTVGPLIFMGDDLTTAVYFQHSGVLEALSVGVSGKYRPVSDIAWAATTGLFGREFVRYVWLNLLIELANTFLFARIAWLVTRGRSRVLVAAAALIFILCRFAYEYVIQLIGLMEVIGLLLFLLIVHDAVLALTQRKAAALWRTLLWFLLIIYTHERYLALAAFLVVVGSAYRGFRWLDVRRFVFVALVVAVAYSNFVLKKYVLGINFFTGTAGTDTQLSSRTLDQMWAGLLNVLGFSSGPEHLVGLTFADAWPVGFALGVAFSVLVLATAVVAAIRLRGAQLRNAAIALLLFASLFFPLLLSASVATLQDLRWLYAPFAALLLAVVAVAAAMPVSAAALRSWTAAFLCVSLATAVYYRGATHNLYFVFEMAFASKLKHAVLDQSYEQRPTIVVTHGVSAFRWWSLQAGDFFNFYSAPNPVAVDFAATNRDARTLIRSLPNARVLDVRDPSVTDITADVLADDFTSTPNRLPIDIAGAKLLDHVSRQARAASATTLPFGSIRVTGIVVPPGDELQFSGVRADGPRALSLFITNASRLQTVRAGITVSHGTAKDRVDVTLAPSGAAGWEKLMMPLARYGGAPISIQIATDAGATGGPGVVISSPTIVPQ